MDPSSLLPVVFGGSLLLFLFSILLVRFYQEAVIFGIAFLTISLIAFGVSVAVFLDIRDDAIQSCIDTDGTPVEPSVLRLPICVQAP